MAKNLARRHTRLSTAISKYLLSPSYWDDVQSYTSVRCVDKTAVIGINISILF